MIKKKIVFIIPYFGKFNNYFQLFLNSCSYNRECDWLIFTDDKRKFLYPENVKVHYITFEKIQKMFRDKFDFPISLEYPYKLCDYKPAYGYIFKEYLSEYSFWGYCDTDLIFGNISEFITNKDLEQYDKIGVLGHCTIFRNEDKYSTAFMKPLNGKLRYKEVYSENKNHSFDEEFKESINNIFQEYGYRIRPEEYEANIYTKSSDFKITRIDFDTLKYWTEKKKKALFLFDRGNIYRYEESKGKVYRKEYLYIHMQSRPMKVLVPEMSDYYKIIPNVFDNLEPNTNPQTDLKNIRIKYPNLHYFILRSKNMADKIKRKLG